MNGMQLHFYASIETINAIQKGDEMLVMSQATEGSDVIHLSVDLDLFSVAKVTDSKNLFKVSRKY